MNETFNIKRFWAYLRRDFALNIVKVTVPLLAMAFLLLMYLWFKFQHYPGAEAMLVFLMMGGAVIVLIMSSKIANSFQQKTSCADFLTVPASMPEKFLTKIVRHFIVPMTFLAVMVRIGVHYENDETLTESFVPLVDMMLLAGGIFLFWGAVFRRLAAVVAVVIVAAIVILLRYMTMNVLDSMNLMWLDPVRIYLQNCDNPKLRIYTFLSVFAALFFIGSAIAAYFIYRRKEMKVKLFNW